MPFPVKKNEMSPFPETFLRIIGWGLPEVIGRGDGTSSDFGRWTVRDKNERI